MGLVDILREEAKKIITDDVCGFAVPMTLTATNGQLALVNGLHTKHTMSVDTDGNTVNTRNAHITFNESNLLFINPNYPLRDSNGKVNMYRHLVDVADSTGSIERYVVREWYPDETLGHVTCILGSYE